MKKACNCNKTAKQAKKTKNDDFAEHYDDRCVCCAKKLGNTAMYIDGGGYVCPVCYNRIYAYFED